MYQMSGGGVERIMVGEKAEDSLTLSSASLPSPSTFELKYSRKSSLIGVTVEQGLVSVKEETGLATGATRLTRRS